MINFGFSTTPRYCLIDAEPWLVGIDPLRRYWLKVNGLDSLKVNVPGLQCDDIEILRDIFQAFRSLAPGRSIELPTALPSEKLTIHCVSTNLYAIPGEVKGAEIWHLFDEESIEAFLRTAHPDWKCAPQDLALGQALLAMSWQKDAAIADGRSKTIV